MVYINPHVVQNIFVCHKNLRNTIKVSEKLKTPWRLISIKTRSYPSVMMEYMIRFTQVHETFRLAEIEALAVLEGIKLEVLSYSPSVSFSS
jgi:hypothetical protein